MQEDWDTLVILDAFRADYFEDLCEFEGAYSTAISPATASREYLERNFPDEYHDTVLTTANPHAEHLEEGTFHDVQRLYTTDWEDGCIPPEHVTNTAIEAHERWPAKRHVVHYMQPHAPFLGETKIRHVRGKQAGDVDQNIWESLRYGLTEKTIADVRTAYRENAEIALDASKNLYDSIEGKMILTADHGELLGDRTWPFPVRGFGHPKDYRVRELVEVPWFEFPFESRRSVVSEEPSQVGGGEEISDSELSDRLEALGYR